MRKHVEESVATGAAAGRGRGGRFSAGRKREVVMRLLRGEDLESVSRAVGITAARASHWRAQFLAAGQAGLKSRATDARDEDHRRLQAKIGEQRWTPSAGQLIDVAKWNLLRYIPVKMRGAEDDKEETAKPFASL